MRLESDTAAEILETDDPKQSSWNGLARGFLAARDRYYSDKQSLRTPDKRTDAFVPVVPISTDLKGVKTSLEATVSSLFTDKKGNPRILSVTLNENSHIRAKAAAVVSWGNHYINTVTSSYVEPYCHVDDESITIIDFSIGLTEKNIHGVLHCLGAALQSPLDCGGKK